MLGMAQIGGAFANEVTNFPVTLSQYVLMLIIALGGACLAAFLVLNSVPGSLVEQEEPGQAQASDRQHEAGVEPSLARERQVQPDRGEDRPDDTEPASRGEHAIG